MSSDTTPLGTERRAPLDGLRVLDLSQVMAGPLAAQCLGDFGADVIKVEPTGTGDVVRPLDRDAAAEGRVSVYFAATNRNKRCIAVDLGRDEGRQLVRRLAAGCDVIVNNYRPGVMERFGLSYDELSAANPGIIYLTVTGFGQTGPLARKPGQDFLAQSLSGLVHRNSHGDPGVLTTPITDWGAGMLLVQGVLLALLERASSGRGQEVYVSLLDSAISYQILEYTALRSQGLHFSPVTATLTDVFATSDGWFTLVGYFRKNPLGDICRALECEDYSQRPGLADYDEQILRRGEVLDLLAAEFRKRTTADIVARLESVDILAAPVLRDDEVIDHPQLAANESWTDMVRPDGDVVRGVANPVRLSETPATVRRPPEHVGESTVDVLRSNGLADDEIERLIAAGIVGTASPAAPVSPSPTATAEEAP